MSRTFDVCRPNAERRPVWAMRERNIDFRNDARHQSRPETYGCAGVRYWWRGDYTAFLLEEVSSAVIFSIYLTSYILDRFTQPEKTFYKCEKCGKASSVRTDNALQAQG